MVTTNVLPVISVKLLNFWWMSYILGLVDSFLDKWVGIPMGTNCAPLLADLFLYSYENEVLDKLVKDGKESLLESLIYHIITLMTLSFSIMKDLRSSFLILTPKNSQSLKPQNLPQLLLISILPEIGATT